MIRTIAAADLPRQVYAHAPDFDLTLLRSFRPIVVGERGWAKPDSRTGMWTATGYDDGTTSWTRWCADEEYRVDDYAAQTDIVPDALARIALIDTLADLRAIIDAYPHGTYRREYPHWANLAADFDAAYLTDAGQWATRLSYPENLYGWDCESVLWLQPAFTVPALAVTS